MDLSGTLPRVQVFLRGLSTLCFMQVEGVRSSGNKVTCVGCIDPLALIEKHCIFALLLSGSSVRTQEMLVSAEFADRR